LHVPSQDLLHHVRLCDVSADARELLKELLREVLAEQGVGQPSAPPGAALLPDAAAAHIGLRKTAFYAALKSDPTLRACSFVHGKRGRRFIPAKLDAWMAAQVAPAESAASPKQRPAIGSVTSTAPSGR
jgi:hypothetical protein